MTYEIGDKIKVFNRTGVIYEVENITDHPDDAKVRFECAQTGVCFETLIVNRNAFTMVSL